MKPRASLYSIALFFALAGLSDTVITDRAESTSQVPNPFSSAYGTSDFSLGEANDQIYNGGNSSPTLRHSIVEGGLPSSTVDGGFNLSQSPEFKDPEGPDGFIGSVDDNLELQPDSPAIDNGSVGFVPLDVFDLDGDGDVIERLPVDFSGHSRYQDGGSGAPAVDVGAYEFQAGATEVDASPPYPDVTVLANLYPNPARERLHIEIKVANGDAANLDLYDILGRKVRTILEGSAGDGEARKFAVDVATLPAGLYLVRLRTQASVAVNKFVVVR